MEDIAPELLKKIRALFLELLGDDAPGADTYAAAGDYAERVGDALATAFQRHLSGDVLPDGRMYWNIADRVLRPLLEEDWRLCADAAAEVQRTLNKTAGIGLAVQAAEPDKGRINGILNTICDAERYEDKAWMLGGPVRTFSRAAVDETLRRNAEFQAKAGLRPRIVRTAEGKCCAWCSALAGTYDYPDVPRDVYRRHANCRCTVEYDPGVGKRQDVWTKRWTDEREHDILEQRKTVGLEKPAKASELLGRFSGKAGDTDGNTTINSVEPFDFSNKTAIRREINIFLEQHSNSPVEHAIVISPNGHLYRLTGSTGSVNTSLVGEDALAGSIGAHNHPVWNGFDSGDSFSKEDVFFSVEYHTGVEYLTSGVRRNAFQYTGDKNADEVREMYISAVHEARKNAWDTDSVLEYEQLAALRILAKKLEGFELYEEV